MRALVNDTQHSHAVHLNLLNDKAMITVTFVEAKNRFGLLLDTVQREPVTTRHGRTAAFIVSPQDMEELTRARDKRSKAVAEFEAGN